MLQIGISSSFEHPDPGRSAFAPKTLFALEGGLAAWLARPGVMPVLVPALERPRLETFLTRLDGLVLQGGADVASSAYGEEPILDGRWPGDRIRDVYELELLRMALGLDLPVFGICRGMQLLNVHFGGTLYQDLAVQRPDAGRHFDPERYDRHDHPVVLQEGSPLADWYEDRPAGTVNSVHHQGIKDLGEGLEVWAQAGDGLIEALGRADNRPGRVFAVQWHPEWPGGEGRLDGSVLLDRWLKVVRS